MIQSVPAPPDTHIKNVFKILTHLVYPASCFNCRCPLPWQTKEPVCGSCAGRLPAAPVRASMPHMRHADDVWSLFFHRGAARRLVHKLKIHAPDYLLPFLVRAVERRAQAREEWTRVQAIVPVPGRGAGPGRAELSLVLARVAGACLRRPIRRCLIRRRGALKQTGLSRRQRLNNARGAFAAPDKGMRLPRHVLLTDDVLTTGATADECARILKTRGAEQVSVLVCARACPR